MREPLLPGSISSPALLERGYEANICVSSNKYGVGDILERVRLVPSVGWVQQKQNRRVEDLRLKKRGRMTLLEALQVISNYH